MLDVEFTHSALFKGSQVTEVGAGQVFDVIVVMHQVQIASVVLLRETSKIRIL